MQKLLSRTALGAFTFGALSLGVVLNAVPASAQTAGPGGSYFGAGSGPQSGGQPVAGTTSPQPTSRTLYNSARQPTASASAAPSSTGPAGPAGANYGAGTNPQNGR
ncbi:MAG TPA: hypothetical protein VH206_13905 [Xanthobacteraceae bacterium]|nr:hypothetical protein [Xanthobacteraceae bacterium]